MSINGAVLNGAVLNGSSSPLKYASVALAAGVALSSAAGVAFSAVCAIPTEGSVSLVDPYVLRVSAAPIPASSIVHIQSTARAFRYADADIAGSGSVEPGESQLHYADADIGAIANILAYTGDSADIEGTATIDAVAGQTHRSDVSATCTASISATVNLHADGVQPIFGGATVDVVPSVEYAGDGYITHDGHCRILGTLTGLVSSDPLRKYSFTSYNPSTAEVTASPFIIHRSTKAIFSSGGSVTAQCRSDRGALGNLSSPQGSVSAAAYRLLSNDELVSVNGISSCIFTARGLKYTLTSVAGDSSIASSPGIKKKAKAVLSCGVTGMTAVAEARRKAFADISGTAALLADLSSNPRAHAVERRTAYIDEQDREARIREEDREMRISPT